LYTDPKKGSLKKNRAAVLGFLFFSLMRRNMHHKRPQPPRPDRLRSIRGSFSWIDHRFLRQGFDQGLTRLEKLLYFVLVAVSNQDGVSFYSDQRLGEILDIRFPHEFTGARDELLARDLIAYEERIYQVLQLPEQAPSAPRCRSQATPIASPSGAVGSSWQQAGSAGLPGASGSPWQQDCSVRWKSLRQLLGMAEEEEL
jgi:hypothetical protein